MDSGIICRTRKNVAPGKNDKICFQNGAVLNGKKQYYQGGLVVQNGKVINPGNKSKKNNSKKIFLQRKCLDLKHHLKKKHLL